MTQKAFSKISIFLVVIIILIVGGFLYYQSQKESKEEGSFSLPLPKEWKICETDADCVETQNGWCSCVNGGRQIAINKKYLDAWNEIISEHGRDIGCPEVMRCKQGKPVCRYNQCKFAEY